MIVYKHKILFRKINNFYRSVVSSVYFLYLIITAILLGILLVFGSKISNTVNDGIKTQSKIDKISKEVAELEKYNEDLKYQKEILNSDTSLEAEIRENNKKKEGEEIYIISLPQQKEEIKAQELDLPTKPKLSNWEKWIKKIF